MDIHQATIEHTRHVATLVECLLLELEPEATNEIQAMDLLSITKTLISQNKIQAFLAMDSADKPIGVITLHECAAIYAGGIFGEISEFYVVPEHRVSGIGKGLMNAAVTYGGQQGWKRIEVGIPEPKLFQHTHTFYVNRGFIKTGLRLRLLL